MWSLSFKLGSMFHKLDDTDVRCRPTLTQIRGKYLHRSLHATLQYYITGLKLVAKQALFNLTQYNDKLIKEKDVLLSQDYNESTNVTNFLKKLWLLLVGSIVRTSFFANQTQGGAKTVPTNPFQR